MNDLISLTIPGANDTPTRISAPPGIPTSIPLGNLAGNLFVAAVGIGIILSLIYLVYGGFTWLQSGGKKETLIKARKIIMYSIIGLIIMSLALVIVNVITSAVGVESIIKR